MLNYKKSKMEQFLKDLVPPNPITYFGSGCNSIFSSIGSLEMAMSVGVSVVCDSLSVSFSFLAPYSACRSSLYSSQI